MGRGDISLADLFIAFHALRPEDQEARDAIFQVLRLEHLKTAAGKAVAGGYDQRQSFEKSWRWQDKGPRGSKMRGVTPPPPPEPVEPRGEPRAVSVERRGAGGEGGERPGWLDDLALLAIAPESPEPVEPPRPEPLFDPLRRRAILGSGLSTRASDGEIDFDQIIGRISRMEPITELPRLPAPTLRHGVQLLLDYSEAMTPFAHDRKQLRGAIEELTGSSRTDVFFFKGCPGRGVTSAARREEEDWKPPPQGAVVVLVSDFGIGGPLTHADRAGVDEWLDFGRRVEAACRPRVGFVPFSPSRWDHALAELFTLIHWDRPTTARSVRRAVGPGNLGS